MQCFGSSLVHTREVDFNGPKGNFPDQGGSDILIRLHIRQICVLCKIFRSIWGHGNSIGTI